MEWLNKLLSSIGIEGGLGGDMFKNLVGMGTDIWKGLQAGDMMDFNKDMANKSMGMQEDVFAMNKEDREKNENLDFTL